MKNNTNIKSTNAKNTTNTKTDNNTFDIGYLLEKSWKMFKKHFWVLLPIIVLFLFIPNMFYSFYDFFNPVNEELLIVDNAINWSYAINYFSTIVTLGLLIFLIGLFGTSCLIYYFLKKKEINGLIKGGSKYYFGLLGLSILISLLFVPALILFVLSFTYMSLFPLFFILFLIAIFFGSVISIYLTFSTYALVDEDRSILEAIKRSYALVKNNWWAVVGRILVASLIILGIILIISFVMILIFILIQGVNFFEDGLSTTHSIISIIINGLLYVPTTLFGFIFSINIYQGLKDKFKKNKMK